MAKLILMVGNIGTGKTTTASKLMAAANSAEDYNTVLISTDDLATILSNKHYGPDIWTNRHIHLYLTTKQFIAREALAHGFNVIVDGTHMSKIARKVFINTAKKFDSKVIVYLHTYPHGLARRIANPKSIHTTAEEWTKIHNDFANSYEIPALDEGINNIIFIKGVESNK